MGKGQKKTVVDPQQLSIFDTLLQEIGQNTVSSTDIGEMLKKLETAKKAAREREEAERRRLKAEKERKKEAEKRSANESMWRRSRRWSGRPWKRRR